MDRTAQEEVDRNYEVFTEMLPGLLQTHAGGWGLFHRAELIEIFDTYRDARTAANRLYPEDHYSIQEITADPIDLGIFSRAIQQAV